MNKRLDSMGGPATKSSRNRVLFGGIGREKSGQTDIQPAAQGGQSAPAQRPTLRKPGQGGPVDLGASNAPPESMIVRRKGTARIPKKGGGVAGEAAPLESMGSGRRPSIDPGPPPRDNLPPVVNVPIPQPRPPAQRQDPPTSPGARGNTLAGVSAEDLLGAEGRAVLEKMRQREQQARQQPQQAPPPPSQPRPLPPRMEDSSRVAFQAAEYSAEGVQEAQADDELAPQGSFLSGPTRQIQRNVVQTPMPAEEVYEGEPPPDDLGYERPVDFGDSGAPTYEDGGTEEEPVARDSAAHDEMEQRAGYMLWLQGVITREEVEDALGGEEEISEPVRDLIANTAFTDQTTLYRFLARHESLSPVDLEQVEPTERALAALRPAIARAYRVVPIDRIGELLLVAAAFPFDPKRLLELRRLTASKVKLFVVTEEEIDIALMKYYPGGQATLRSPRPAGIDEPAEEVEDESAVTGEGDALEYKYDPTLSGEDSGLYAPIDPNAANRPPSDVEMAELDEHAALGSKGDLDESTLGGAPDSGAFANATTDPDVEVPEEIRDSGEGEIDTGPEELDPFA
ncbi:MAG: hypothetical protein H6839_07590 [Planctomycetes bacterium]|nr:hypothetical protein [Planctomycetota bacterium]